MSDCSTSSVISAKQSSLALQIDISVLRKEQDAAKSQGDAVLQLLESAVQLSKSTTTGGTFDAVA